jgi:hypothetical protein
MTTRARDWSKTEKDQYPETGARWFPAGSDEGLADVFQPEGARETTERNLRRAVPSAFLEPSHSETQRFSYLKAKVTQSLMTIGPAA